MNEQPVHTQADCARVWQMLRMAHDRVEARLSRELGAIGLTISEFDVLLHLHAVDSEDVRIGSIQQCVQLSQSALSRLVSRLSERGLVYRLETEEDGRAINLRLTDTGRELASQAIALHSTVIQSLLSSQLTPEEQDLLSSALARIGAGSPLTNPPGSSPGSL